MQDRFDLGGIERGLRGVDLSLGRLTFPAARLLDLREDLPNGGRESLLAPHSAEVHEHDPRRIPEEVIVQRRNLEAIVEGGAHHRVHLILQQDHVAHDDRVLADALEGSPRCQPHRRRHAHPRNPDVQVAARHGNFEGSLSFIQLALFSCELLDPARVELGLVSHGLPRRARDRRDQNQCRRELASFHVAPVGSATHGHLLCAEMRA